MNVDCPFVLCALQSRQTPGTQPCSPPVTPNPRPGRCPSGIDDVLGIEYGLGFCVLFLCQHSLSVRHSYFTRAMLSEQDTTPKQGLKSMIQEEDYWRTMCSCKLYVLSNGAEVGTKLMP